MDRKSKRQPVSQAPQHRTEDVPCDMAVRPDCLHDLIELDVVA
jgi:hypothetical protein